MANRLLHYFTNLWDGQGSLGERFVSSSAIVFAEKVVIKAAQFVRTVIVARLLFPEDLGLFAMASLAMTATEVFSQTGFNSAIIHEKNSQKYLNSAWTVNVIRGVILSLVLFFVVAPWAGNFFNNDAVIPFARALALVFLISGFENIAIILFHKELQFFRMTVYSVSGFFVQIAAVIISAFILRNAWALVIGLIAGRTAFLILSFWVHPYRPKLTFDFSGATRLFKFGRWIALTGVTGFLVSQGDSAIVGRLLDATSLGFYNIAFGLGMLPAVELARSFSSVLFPLYSKFQGDLRRLRVNFIRVSRVIFAVSIPASVGLFILAPEIVRFVYGEKWLPVVPVLYFLIFLGISRAFEYLVNPLFLGIGKPKIQMYVLVVQFLVIFSLIVPLTKGMGMEGTAVAVLIGSVVAALIYFYRLKRDVQIGFRTMGKILGLPVLSSLLMGLVIFYGKGVIPISNIFIFVSYLVAGILIYFSIFFLLDRFLGNSRFYKSLVWIKNSLSS